MVAGDELVSVPDAESGSESERKQQSGAGKKAAYSTQHSEHFKSRISAKGRIVVDEGELICDHMAKYPLI